MNCPRCGTVCANNQEFCSNCGSKLANIQMPVNNATNINYNYSQQQPMGVTLPNYNVVGNNQMPMGQVNGIQMQPTVQPMTQPMAQPMQQQITQPMTQPMAQPMPQQMTYSPIGVQQPNNPNQQQAPISPDVAAYQQNATILQQVNAIKPTLNTAMIEREKRKTDRENRLMDAFIGRNTDKIRKGGFSFASFFFGNIYVLYRRVFGIGFVWTLAMTIVAYYVPKFILLFLALNLFMSIKFKDIYVEIVRKKVNEIIDNNSDLPDDELAKICYQKGGTGVFYIFIVSFILSVIFSTLYILTK